MEYEHPKFTWFLEDCPKDRSDWFSLGIPDCLGIYSENSGLVQKYIYISESEWKDEEEEEERYWEE